MDQKRYWRRGGIISFIAGTVIAILLFVIAFTTEDIGNKYGSLALALFNLLYGIFLAFPLGLSNLVGIPYLLILFVPVYDFCLGALIGLIYGKIRS